MKRLPLKLTLAILTFVIGVASAILLSEVPPLTVPPIVTLCQLAQNPSFYDGQTVRVIADGRGGIFSSLMYIEDETCNSPDAWSGVSLVANIEPSGETQKLLPGSDSVIYKARVLVTGRFEPRALTDCVGSEKDGFGIEATNVELKSEITTEPRPKFTQQ